MNTPVHIEGKKILIVDDDASMRLLVRRMLSRMGIANLAEAEGGAQALHLLELAPVDLVLCDWNMPAMSGLEFVARARSLRPELLFLMLTGRADAESQATAKQAGIAGFMVKPISAPDLKARITQLLSTAG